MAPAQFSALEDTQGQLIAKRPPENCPPPNVRAYTFAGWGRAGLVVSTRVTEFILGSLYINYCIIFHM